MIHFFGNIRKQLFAKNRFTNYFLYALGEIFLVVIGILIAVQINSWNESRKIRREEINLLNAFISDLNNDIVLLELNITRTRERQVKIDTIFEILANPSDDYLNLFVRLQTYVMEDNYFIPNQGTFDQGVSTGELKYINNEKLRGQIFSYYKKISNDKSDDQAVYKVTNDYIIPIIAEEILSKKIFVQLLTGKNSSAPELDLKEIAKNPRYYRSLIYTLSDRAQITDWTNFKKEAINLKENIQLELKNRK
jgi:hypothetical protein